VGGELGEGGVGGEEEENSKKHEEASKKHKQNDKDRERWKRSEK